MLENKVILSVTNLSKTFKKNFITKELNYNCINNVSFELEHGQSLGLFGPNGSGKTTIIHMLLDILTPTSGEIKYFDKDLNKNRSTILQDLAFASIYSKFPSKLTVYENLDIHSRIYGINKTDRKSKIENYLNMFDLINLKNMPTGILSSGQSSRLMLIKAFITNPKIALLDEPTATLDLESENFIKDFIKTKKETDNISIILASHNVNELIELCEKVLLIKHGQIKETIFCRNNMERETAKKKLIHFRNS